MTDRMTERFDTTDGPGPEGSGTASYGAAGLDEQVGSSETVTRSAAVDEGGFGQMSGAGSSGDAGAKEHAQAVAQDAKESTKGVASTAASEAKDVAREARTQLRSLVDQLGSEATDQASSQTQRAVQGLRSLSNELSGMADNQQGDSGMASDLARQGASRLGAAADWLDGRQPGELLEEVRSFARRRPGAFIAGAAVLGLIGGRMTRGLTADTSGGGSESTAGTSSYGTAASLPPSSAAVSSGYGTGTAYATGTGYDSGTAYVETSGEGDLGYAAESLEPAEPVDLTDTDPSRVDAGIDPATYTHPGTSPGATGESR